MKEVFLAFRTDNWHSYKSFELMEVFTTKHQAINAIKNDIRSIVPKDEYNRILDQLINQLESINQTQSISYEFDGEYVISNYPLNKVL